MVRSQAQAPQPTTPPTASETALPPSFFVAARLRLTRDRGREGGRGPALGTAPLDRHVVRPTQRQRGREAPVGCGGCGDRPSGGGDVDGLPSEGEIAPAVVREHGVALERAGDGAAL